MALAAGAVSIISLLPLDISFYISRILSLFLQLLVVAAAAAASGVARLVAALLAAVVALSAVSFLPPLSLRVLACFLSSLPLPPSWLAFRPRVQWFCCGMYPMQDAADELLCISDSRACLALSPLARCALHVDS